MTEYFVTKTTRPAKSGWHQGVWTVARTLYGAVGQRAFVAEAYYASREDAYKGLAQFEGAA